MAAAMSSALGFAASHSRAHAREDGVSDHCDSMDGDSEERDSEDGDSEERDSEDGDSAPGASEVPSAPSK